MDPVPRGDPAASFAEVTDAERMRSVVEQYLRAPGSPPIEVVACEVEFARRGPPRSLFQYQISLRDPTSGGESIQVVSGVAHGGKNRTQRAWERLRRQHPVTPAAGTALARAAYVPELDLLLQTFPFDQQLPALEPLMTGPLPGLLAPLLARFGPGDWRLEEWDAKSMRYRVDLRACIRVTVRAREAGTGEVAERRFFAKIYASAERTERAWGRQQNVAAALAAVHEPLAVAPLVAYLRDERVLVQDEVDAVSLADILRSADTYETAEAVRRTARAVAALHRLHISAPARTIELGRTDPERLRRSAGLLRAARPDLSPMVDDIEAGVLAGLEAIGEIAAVPIHGDLKPQHILLDENRVVLLDLDKFAAGEPMLDVTNILIVLGRERYSRRKDSIALTRAFVGEYFAHVPAAWEPRLAPHYAWALLGEASAASTKFVKEGHKVSGSSRRAEMETRVNGLLEEARTLLAGRL